jgi:predicted RNase H-like HicB family nuclease
MPNRKPSRSLGRQHLIFNIETEREADGRWIAEIVDIPGVLAYGANEKAAKANAYALALRVIADRAEKRKTFPKAIEVTTTP